VRKSLFLASAEVLQGFHGPDPRLIDRTKSIIVNLAEDIAFELVFGDHNALTLTKGKPFDEYLRTLKTRLRKGVLAGHF